MRDHDHPGDDDHEHDHSAVDDLDRAVHQLVAYVDLVISAGNGVVDLDERTVAGIVAHARVVVDAAHGVTVERAIAQHPDFHGDRCTCTYCLHRHAVRRLGAS